MTTTTNEICEPVLQHMATAIEGGGYIPTATSNNVVRVHAGQLVNVLAQLVHINVAFPLASLLVQRRELLPEFVRASECLPHAATSLV